MSQKSFLKVGNFADNQLLKQLLSNSSNEAKKRLLYKPPVCSVFKEKNITTETMKQYKLRININSKKQLNNILNENVCQLINSNKNNKFSTKIKRIGIVFSGGPAPGGHNVIAGLFDALKKANINSSLFGFIMGPDGILEENYTEITETLVNKYRNLGSFNMIKTGRTKIDTNEKIKLSKRTCKNLKLNAIVIVGGDDSNTNAAFLAQELFKEKINIIGVPKTIDGDIQIRDINKKVLCATPFGFDTSTKTFSHIISNLCTDAESDMKYWHICKVMGRVASHVALEIAFQTHPNLTLIGEELVEHTDNNNKYIKSKGNNFINYNAYGMKLNQLIDLICDAILKRARIGKNFGIIVFPEGILEFINEIQVLIIKLNFIISKYNSINNKTFHETLKTLDQKKKYIKKLTYEKYSKTHPIWNIKDNDLFNSLPKLLQQGLFFERDSHGNFQFSQVKTEKILLKLIKNKLKILQKKGKYFIGIHLNYFIKTIKQDNLDENIYGPILFRNWNKNKYLLLKNITSKKDLFYHLNKFGLVNKKSNIPRSIIKIFEKSIPNFKAQNHFYGYDGRSNNPTKFDCTYAYNLGLTAFHLINNNITGHIASILNLNKDFEQWKPIGIPMAPLMHLEERNGKLALVLEKTITNTKSYSFNIFKLLRTKWLASNELYENYKASNTIELTTKNNEIKGPITTFIDNLNEK